MPRLAHTLQLATALLAAGAAWAGWHHHWPALAFLAYGTFYGGLLALGAGAPPTCCQISKHSNGQAHGAGCTRPPLPRRDTYRLTETERDAFEEITAGFDDRSAA
ncbi:hypothetical protein [Streptomyces griseorubiginosus]|uniref:hypothetical protein n=1 Tax=Streptomyces griseorubiginosus TaxID=67304 RepID=UPI0036EEF35A